MNPAKAPAAIPQSYTLKRHIARHAHRFWCPIDVVGVYSEGKINNVAAFAEFLKKPLDSKNLRAAK